MFSSRTFKIVQAAKSKGNELHEYKDVYEWVDESNSFSEPEEHQRNDFKENVKPRSEVFFEKKSNFKEIKDKNFNVKEFTYNKTYDDETFDDGEDRSEINYDNDYTMKDCLNIGENKFNSSNKTTDVSPRLKKLQEWVDESNSFLEPEEHQRSDFTENVKPRSEVFFEKKSNFKEIKDTNFNVEEFTYNKTYDDETFDDGEDRSEINYDNDYTMKDCLNIGENKFNSSNKTTDVSPRLKKIQEPVDNNESNKEKINIMQNITLWDNEIKNKLSTSDQYFYENVYLVKNKDIDMNNTDKSEMDNDFEEDNDDSRDKDFNIKEYTEDDTSDAESFEDYKITHEINCDATKDCPEIIENKLNTNKTPVLAVLEKYKPKKNKKELEHCRYCSEDIPTLNFARHMQRKHINEKEVIDIMNFPKKSKERREAFALLRNGINFDLYIQGTLRPHRQNTKALEESKEYYPCANCKGLYLKKYLKRHAKSCICKISNKKKQGKVNHVSESQTEIACALDVTETISMLNVKEQVFNLMKGDKIALEAKKDLLIVHFGESYLKKHKREHLAYTCSSRMRELARLLIAYRIISKQPSISLKEILHPKYFDVVLAAARNISGYEPQTKTFVAASLAMHLGTSLKAVCDELNHLILKESHGFRFASPAEAEIYLKNVKKFRKLVESRWTLELSSLANKVLQENRWKKPLLVPLVSDVKLFRDECLRFANDCVLLFENQNDTLETYKLLVNCSLALLIVFNRRRIGDVQFLKIDDYKENKKSNFLDFENALSETEKILTKKYRRVVNGGKGSRAVVILIPQVLENFINVLIQHREKYIEPNNEFVFAIPNSTIKWGKGDVAIRLLLKKIELKEPKAFSSNKLRKHIATVIQILNLSQEEVKQFSTFMGHSKKTHEEFYELPIDIYQTAKVSKLLLMMEKGTLPMEFKGKSLAEINFDEQLEYAIEDDDNEEQIENKMNETDLITTNKSLMDDPTTSSVYNSELTLPTFSQANKRTLDMRENISNEENKEETSEKINSRKCIKKRWSQQEVGGLKEAFASFLKNKTYPSGSEIKEFITRTRSQRTIPMIKSKLQYLMQINSE